MGILSIIGGGSHDILWHEKSENGQDKLDMTPPPPFSIAEPLLVTVSYILCLTARSKRATANNHGPDKVD